MDATTTEKTVEIKETCYVGTRILVGNEKREIINKMTEYLRITWGFSEISIPIIQYEDIFSNKIGDNGKMMYQFVDRGNRRLCLAPEYTAVVQQLAKTTFKKKRDVMLFYVQECFRGEKPQHGRFRQFTQFGVEILNPTRDMYSFVVSLAEDLIRYVTPNFTTDINAVRGLDYYTGGRGFEIRCDALGSSKQVCGGGEYEGGIGFAIGIDRLMLVNK